MKSLRGLFMALGSLLIVLGALLVVLASANHFVQVWQPSDLAYIEVVLVAFGFGLLLVGCLLVLIKSQSGRASSSPPGPDFERLEVNLDTLAQRIRALRLIRNNQPVEQLRQNEELVAMLKECGVYLQGAHNQVQLAKKRSPSQIEYSRLYIKAALLELNIELFSIRWNSATYWTDESGAYPSPIPDVDRALRAFDVGVKVRGVRRSYLTNRMIESAFRTWADELSPEATIDSGWLEAAAKVERMLRLRYQRARTREIWSLAFAPRAARLVVTKNGQVRTRRQRPQLLRRTATLVHAAFRGMFDLISGYGMRGGRFALATIVLVGFFTGLYWVLDASSGCSHATLEWQHGLDYFLLSLATFSRGSGNVPMCEPDASAIQAATTAEALAGYVMLGVLVSVFWYALYEAITQVSSIRLRESRTQETAGD